jgi:FkbM family methyltransferase
MLISFSEIVNKYGKPKGIVHIGAHLMEERPDYISHGLYNTIWIEANANVYRNIEFINDGSYSERAFNYAISNVDNQIFSLNITNNGQSSSILELDKHKIHHPHIYVTEVIDVESRRIDTLFSENNINYLEYDFVNIDIQGAELLAIKGFGDIINNIKYIYTEVNTNSLYKDCALLNEIDEYLDIYGFTRVETSMTEYEWGDALYIKNNLI